LVGKMSKKIHDHVLNGLPFLFPFALNLLTGSSFGFMFFWFFLVVACFILINGLKIHENFIQNAVVRIILDNLAYILTFFFYINMWATTSAEMPYVIVSK
jgi:hypothetical protein